MGMGRMIGNGLMYSERKLVDKKTTTGCQRPGPGRNFLSPCLHSLWELLGIALSDGVFLFFFLKKEAFMHGEQI